MPEVKDPEVRDVLLKCEVTNGLFPAEAGVFFQSLQGEDISLYALKKYVDEKRKGLHVKLFDKQGDVASVRLPAESLNGYRIVQVKVNQLEE